MYIGTPFSLGTTKAMLSGSGELGKEVIIALQCPGVEVIAVDRYANADDVEMARENAKKIASLIRSVKAKAEL
ncbi:phosphoribosylglycinamide formyltransferase 2 [bacterium BMS3Abin11]|nr:phosphoribosylglycinamide formyltransferase 2 [bacterium BMS3Abin11]GMT41261.1 MAG: hypothetical protein IEMM0001_1996 [bacterium]